MFLNHVSPLYNIIKSNKKITKKKKKKRKITKSKRDKTMGYKYNKFKGLTSYLYKSTPETKKEAIDPITSLRDLPIIMDN